MLKVFSLLLVGASLISANVLQTRAADKDWDYLLFVQRWPQSVCDSMARNECEIPSNVADWLVHGLWPNYNDGSYPQFCDKNDKFDVKQVEQFRSQLEQVWANLERGKTEESLWAHEWEKHGTCAKTLDLLSDEQKYFSHSLDLLNNYHIGKALAKNNIVPSDTKSYTKAEIEQALRDNLGNGSDLFDLACVRGQLPRSSSGVVDHHHDADKKDKNSKHQLVEARACLDKQLNLISCPDSKNTVRQRAKRAIFNMLNWVSTSVLPVTPPNHVGDALSADDASCPSSEIYIPVFSR